MLMPENNFLENFGKDDLKTFRKRMVGCIVATDMAKHKQDLDMLNFRIQNNDITKERDNGYDFIDQTSADTVFDTQQQLLEMALHCSDLTPGSRDFATAKKWTYLLFEEFFHQGDVEKRENLPVSFLCDRVTTNVASNQPGFINFIVMPLFKSMTTVLPGMGFLVKRAVENAETWKNYEETD